MELRFARSHFDPERSAIVESREHLATRGPGDSRLLDRMAIASINPATGEKLKQFPTFNDEEIEKRLKRAEHAFTHHRRQPFAKRGQLMMAAASLLEQERDKLARTMTLEMGKLFRAALDEIAKCVRACRFYAENGERFLEDEAAQTDAARSYVRYEALGP